MTIDETADANVAGLFERSAARRGGAPGVVDADGRVLWSFDDLGEAAARFAGGLADLGVGRGDRVLVLEPDPRQAVRAAVGAIWAGACVAFPPASLPARSAIRVAGEASPRAVVASVTLMALAMASGTLRRAQVRVTSGRGRVPGTIGAAELERHQPIGPQSTSASSPALLSYTTGSTGLAKAVVRTHGVLRAQHDALEAVRGLGDGDRDLAGLSTLVLHNLGSGVTSVLGPRRPGSAGYGRNVLAAIARGRATSAAGFPHLFESAVAQADGGELAGLRSMYLGGSRVRPALLAALRSRNTQAAITVVYGSTEAEPIATIDAEEYVRLLEEHDPEAGICVGRIGPGLELRLQPGRDGDPTSATEIAVGNILVRGARASLSDGLEGWVDTGDVGRLDNAGRLWLLGRAANTVGTLHQLEAERAAEAQPWVGRAAFVGRLSPAQRGGLLAVQPVHWGRPDERANQVRRLGQLARDRTWQLERVMLFRRLPVVRGVAAKVDGERLRRLAKPGGGLASRLRAAIDRSGSGGHPVKQRRVSVAREDPDERRRPEPERGSPKRTVKGEGVE